MEIEINKDKTVTIIATEGECSVITSAIVAAYNEVCVANSDLKDYYKPIVNALNKFHNEQIAPRLDSEL